MSTAEDLVYAIREPQVPFNIVKMTDVTLNACPAGRFNTFCQALKFNRSLRTLTVTIDDSEFQALIDALNVNRTVTRVNMTVRYLDVDVEKMLTNDTCQKLSDMLTRNHVLKKLHMTVRHSCAAIFSILGNSFVRPRNAQVTLVIEDKMGKAEFERLIVALNNSNITALKIGSYFSSGFSTPLSRTQCSVEGTRILCNYMRTFGCSLEILKLRTLLNMEQATQFAQMIEANPRSLKTFYYEASTHFEAIEVIAKAVTYNIIIRKFLIACVPSKIQMYEYLFQNLLRQNHTLESLAVINCPDTKELWKITAKELTDNNSLRSLYLLRSGRKKSLFHRDIETDGKLGPTEGQYGIDCIKDNQSLTKVVLDNVINCSSFSQTELQLNVILKRNRKAQNEAIKDMIVIMFNIARTTALPIDIWTHVFNHIRINGINRDFSNILADIYNDPSPRNVIN